jgi:hypothetical protein
MSIALTLYYYLLCSANSALARLCFCCACLVSLFVLPAHCIPDRFSRLTLISAIAAILILSSYVLMHHSVQTCLLRQIFPRLLTLWLATHTYSYFTYQCMHESVTYL